ncbi:MAG TPA: phage tail protein [Vampirovibrionales bacterium]
MSGLKVIPITEGDYLVTIEGIAQAYWETFSGVSDTTQVTEYSDGRSNRLHKLIGPRQVENVTLTKPYNPIQDKAIIEWWRKWCSANGEEVTITVQPVRYCPDPINHGTATTMLGCKPTSLKYGNVDKKSANISMLELVFAVDDYTPN